MSGRELPRVGLAAPASAQLGVASPPLLAGVLLWQTGLWMASSAGLWFFLLNAELCHQLIDKWRNFCVLPPLSMDWLLVLDVTLAFWRISCSCLHFGKHTVFNWCMVIVPQHDISVYVMRTVQTRAVVITITRSTHHISPWGVSRVVSPGYFEMLSAVFILPCCRNAYVLPCVHLHPCTC